MTKLIKNYFWPLFGGLVGLLLAILIIAIGLFKSIVILIFVILGIVSGYYIQKFDLLSNPLK